MDVKLLFISAFCGLVINAAAQGNGTINTENQKWGYVEVRPGANIFWWLHYTTASKNPTERPLIVVITGGPGTASSYFTNFDDIGPVDVNLNPRNTSWVHSANVLFVDSPVGTGFSLVKSDDLFATTDAQVADDFVNVLRGFYEEVPSFKNVPVYIFSYGYGSKTAVEVALNVHEAVKSNNLTSNIRGLGLGSSWISPIDYIYYIPVCLYQLGYIDTSEFNQLVDEAKQVKLLANAKNWTEAFLAYKTFIRDVERLTGGIDIFNVASKKQLKYDTTREVQDLVHKVKTGLKLNTSLYEVYNEKVFNVLGAEFVKPAFKLVERVLNETDISVAVYNGQLDSSASILGTIDWLTKLHVNDTEIWSSGKKEVIKVNGIVEGYKETVGKLSFYTVLRAGHLVARDNPKAMQVILEEVTDNFKV